MKRERTKEGEKSSNRERGKDCPVDSK